MIHIFLIIEVSETKWLLLCLLSTQISPGGLQDSCSSSTKKTGSEPAVKKPRIETPSPLPTFKVGIDSSDFDQWHLVFHMYASLQINYMFAGEKGEIRGQNHCSTAASFAFWKGKFSFLLSSFLCFFFVIFLFS